MKTHFVIDFETLGTSEDSVVLSMAITLFEYPDEDEPKQLSFDHYLSNSMYWKFDVQSQVDDGRTINENTLEWWAKQDKEVQYQQLEPSENDITLDQFLKSFYDFCSSNDITKDSIGWCRGKEFDFGILKHIVKTTKHKVNKDICPMNENFFPIHFSNRKDIRDYISGLMMSPEVTKVPIPDGELEGFKYHDPVHDCARAVLHILYAHKYANGMEIPDNVDPNSNK